MKVSRVLLLEEGLAALTAIQELKALGLESVVLYRDESFAALYVQQADHAYAWPTMPQTRGTRKARLMMSALVALAQRAEVDAILPGAHALGKEREFCDLAQDADLVWLGPEPQPSLPEQLRAYTALPEHPPRDHPAQLVEVSVLRDQWGNMQWGVMVDVSLRCREQVLIAESMPDTSEYQIKIRETLSEFLEKLNFIGVGAFTFGFDAQKVLISCAFAPEVAQTQHLVELLLGVSLYRELIRLSQGLALEVSQPDIANQHAIEFTLTAVDPALGFLPSSGTITSWHLPAQPLGRVMSAVEAGQGIALASEPNQWDDPLASIVITGLNRSEVLQRAEKFFDEIDIGGIATPVEFYRQLLLQQQFRCDPVHRAVWGEKQIARMAVWLSEVATPTPVYVPKAMRRFPVWFGGQRVWVRVPEESAADISERDLTLEPVETTTE